jgi:ubiquinone/menaquinone biosynthesis C-methylase UbiE
LKNSDLINKNILDFYNRASEEERLLGGLGPLEFERNKELILKFIANENITIADIGGGPGIYSEWLAQMGHKVVLVDPVPKHILQAEKRSKKLKNKFTAALGESRNLDLPDNMADLVILHGPLYHLQQRDDRIKSITEARRITKPGGIILGFAINYMASTLVGLLNGLLHEKEFHAMCKKELKTGIHNSPKGWPGMLPEAFFHRPEELKAEFMEAGLEFIRFFSVEGLIWLEKDYFTTRANHDRYSQLKEINKILETDTNALSLSPHMMIAVRRTD